MIDQLAALKQIARFCVKRDAVDELAAATLEWDEDNKHLRVTFFLEGTAPDIDLAPLDLALGEIVGARWQSIETAGAVYVFDRVLLAEALTSAALIFRR